MHKTSLNINQDIFAMKEDTALAMGISISTLIKRVIARFSKRYTAFIEYRACSVQYQPAAVEWHVFPIEYTDSEYEQAIDIRKVWKLSVSFFVAMAFLHFLYQPDTSEVAENEKRLKNSYMITEYTFKKDIVENRLMFTLIWGKIREIPQRE